MILDIKSQHANPDLCRQLMEAGVSTETVMVWTRFRDTKGDWAAWGLSDPDKDGRRGVFGEHSARFVWGSAPVEMLPAYSVAELGEVLKPYGCTYETRTRAWWWEAGFWCALHDITRYPTEADARAALLLYLISEGAR